MISRDCQVVNALATPKVCLLQLVEVPFERTGMRLVGSLELSAQAHVSLNGVYSGLYLGPVPHQKNLHNCVVKELF